MGVKCILTGQTVKPSSDDFNITEEGTFSIIKKITEVQSVEVLPENPDPNVLYLIKEGEYIHVVESEKTALIASLYYPDRIFVGTGGKNGLHDIEDNMILYPDLDAIDYWSSRKGAIIHEWWNDFTCALEDKDDIGDAIIKTLKI